MKGPAPPPGQMASERVMMSTSGRSTRVASAPTSPGPAASTIRAPGATAPAHVTSSVASTSAAEPGSRDPPTCSSASGGSANRVRKAATSAASIWLTPTTPIVRPRPSTKAPPGLPSP